MSHPTIANDVGRVHGRLPELDGLRGIACILVLMLHIITNNLPTGLQTALVSHVPGASVILAGGVDLFFVLSGFLIGRILLESRNASNFFRVFWTRRAARILPVYILLLCTFVAALAVRPMVDAPWMDVWLLKPPPIPFWNYATFTQNYVMATVGDTGPLWMGITWSLAVEEQFYLVFPLLVFLLPKRVLVFLALAAIIFAALLRTYIWNRTGVFYAGYFPTPSRVDSLMFGFLATCLVRAPTIMSYLVRYRPILDTLALLGFALVLRDSFGVALPTLRYTLLCVVFAYAILRIFITEGGWYRAALRTPFLVYAGLISYALYMYHQAINGLLHGLIFHHAPRMTNWSEFGVTGLVVVVSVLLAALSTRFFETPIRTRARSMRYVFEPVIHCGGQVT